MQECTVLCGTFSCVLGWIDAHATAIVALVAIAFTATQITLTQRHNRLSVRPFVVLWLQQSKGEERSEIVLTLHARNYGLGPAYIDSVEYRFNGRAVNVRDQTELETAVGEILGKERLMRVSPLFEFHGKYAIPKDGDLPLIEAVIFRDMTTAIEPVPVLREKVAVAIRYRSMYEERDSAVWPETNPTT
jgi:hypothetical protein